ncbi:MAG TPA: hypothetical protein V6C72_16970 [Chroococcales cyanobacterium]
MNSSKNTARSIAWFVQLAITASPSFAQAAGESWGFDLSSAAPPVVFGVGAGGAGNGSVAAPPLGIASAVAASSAPTGRQSTVPAWKQTNPQPPQAMLSTLSNHGGRLPQTSMDSFVMDAGGSAELIYGDEGDTSIPPYFNFTDEHHINAGIHSNLTTGHASNLPEAWGFPQ